MLLYNYYSLDYIKELLINPDNGLWFLIVLFVIQLWYLLLELVSSKITLCSKKSLTEGVVGIVFISIIYILNKYNSFCSGLYTNINFYIMFFTGNFCAKYLNQFFKNDIFLLASALCFIALAPSFHMWQNNSAVLILLVSICALIIVIRLSLALESIELKNNKLNRLQSFGQSSLAIYAIHFYLVKFFNGIKFDVSDIYPLPLFLILVILGYCTCYLCICLTKIISRINLLNLLLLGKRNAF